jgi:hypothetical protein
MVVMATKDITDIQVVRAFVDAKATGVLADAVLMQRTGQPEKVVYRAMERAERRGLIDCGVSLRAGWPTERGLELLTDKSAEWDDVDSYGASA